MPLKRPRSPKTHAPLLQEYMKGMSSVPPERTGKPSKPNEPELRHRIPVFTVGLKTVLRPGGLSDLRPSSWRYLIRGRQGPAHVVDVADSLDPAESAALQQVRHGESARLLEKSIRSSEKHKKLERHDYSVRVLRVPALHFSALWLKASAKKQDVLVPLRSMYPELRAGQHYSREEVETVLRAGAERVLGFES
jgi:hypothetical protein